VITAGNGTTQPTGYSIAAGTTGIATRTCAGNLDLLKSLLAVKLKAKMVNCWKLLKGTISSEAYAVMRLNVQRLGTESC